MGRRGLRVLLTIFGLVAVTFGALSVLLGGAMVQGAGTVAPSVDSELRYYGAWYALAGVLVLRAAREVESNTWLIRAVCAALFAGGCGRVISFVAAGTPHPTSLVLMSLELVLPVVIVSWQAAVARRAR